MKKIQLPSNENDSARIINYMKLYLMILFLCSPLYSQSLEQSQFEILQAQGSYIEILNQQQNIEISMNQLQDITSRSKDINNALCDQVVSLQLDIVTSAIDPENVIALNRLVEQRALNAFEKLPWTLMLKTARASSNKSEAMKLFNDEFNNKQEKKKELLSRINITAPESNPAPRYQLLHSECLKGNFTYSKSYAMARAAYHSILYQTKTAHIGVFALIEEYRDNMLLKVESLP